jgi:hypothetical protein
LAGSEKLKNGHPEGLENERAPPLQAQEHLLIRSDKGKTGYKGVAAYNGRYITRCNIAPCHDNYLGTFDTPEDAAQSYLQHGEKQHPEKLEKERAPPLQVQGHLLIRTDKGQTGFKGVHPHYGRYQTKCTTPPCHDKTIGTFVTPEEAAQTYLQHHQHIHSHHPVADTWFQCDDCNKWRRLAGDLDEEEQWCCKDSGGLYTCEDEEEAEEEEHQSTAVPGHRDVVGMQGEVITSQATAGSNMDGSEQRMKSDNPEEREKDRALQGHQVHGGGKKRKHESLKP